jgi:hypothetical protein
MSYKTLIVILSTTIGISLLVNISSVAAAGGFRIHEIFYSSLVLMAGGLIFSSMAFKETHETGNDMRYLTLPCSNLEKTLSKFIMTTVCYVILSMIIYFLVTMIAAGFTLLVFGKNHVLFNPFDRTTLRVTGIFLVIQSIFVFGSVYFKRMAFAKTILSVIGVVIILSLVSGLIYTIFHIDIFLQTGFKNFASMGPGFDPGFFVDFFKTVPGIIFWCLLAPFFWVVTYFRLKEKEV